MKLPMSAIVSPDLLRPFVTTTLTFEELTSHDGEELGSANNPYAVIELTIFAIVKAGVNLKGSSGHTVLKSKQSPMETGLNEIELRLGKPQRGFGFLYRTPQAVSLKVTALDSHEAVLEEGIFQGGEGYAGLVRAQAEIAVIRITVNAERLNAAEDPCLYIDDLSIGRELKAGY